MTEQDQILLKTLVAMAWADGQIAPGETEWIEQVFDQLQVDEDLKERLLSSPQALPSGEELRRVLETPQDREDLLRILTTLSLADGTTCSREMSMLGDLARRLGVDAALLEEIRQHTLA